MTATRTRRGPMNAPRPSPACTELCARRPRDPAPGTPPVFSHASAASRCSSGCRRRRATPSLPVQPPPPQRRVPGASAQQGPSLCNAPGPLSRERPPPLHCHIPRCHCREREGAEGGQRRSQPGGGEPRLVKWGGQEGPLSVTLDPGSLHTLRGR